jgi:hypothetical protein
MQPRTAQDSLPFKFKFSSDGTEFSKLLLSPSPPPLPAPAFLILSLLTAFPGAPRVGKVAFGAAKCQGGVGNLPFHNAVLMLLPNAPNLSLARSVL